MAGSTLFGYTVEEDDGKLVITLTGSIAELLLRKYTAEGIDQDPRLLSSLLPFGHLGSRPVLFGSQTPRKMERQDHPPDIKEIFGQGFDRSNGEFEAQLAEYRNLLAGGTSRSPGASPNKTVTKRAQKRSARRK